MSSDVFYYTLGFILISYDSLIHNDSICVSSVISATSLFSIILAQYCSFFNLQAGSSLRDIWTIFLSYSAPAITPTFHIAGSFELTKCWEPLSEDSPKSPTPLLPFLSLNPVHYFHRLNVSWGQRLSISFLMVDSAPRESPQI